MGNASAGSTIVRLVCSMAGKGRPQLAADKRRRLRCARTVRGVLLGWCGAGQLLIGTCPPGTAGGKQMVSSAGSKVAMRCRPRVCRGSCLVSGPRSAESLTGVMGSGHSGKERALRR